MGGKAAGMSDSRDMFPQAIRAVAEVQPRAFIFENVRGLLRPAFSNYVDYIKLQMEFPDFPVSQNVSWDQNLRRLQRHKESVGDSDMGLRYRVHQHQANAADFGIPQQRHRVFFIGFRCDLSTNWSFPKETHSDCGRNNDMNLKEEVASSANNLLAWKPLQEAIRDLPSPT